MTEALWWLALALPLLVLLVWWGLLRARARVPAPARAPARPPVDPDTPVPTRYEYKLLLMVVTGEKDLAYLTGHLFPLDRTQRGAIPERIKRFVRALLHPMLARGWVSRVDKGNPGLWGFAIEAAGYRALQRVQDPPVMVWPPEHARPARR